MQVKVFKNQNYSRLKYCLSDHIQNTQYLLNRNNLKRSSYPHSHPQNKIQRPPNKGHHLQADFITMVFNNILKLYSDLKFQLQNLYGNSRVLQVRTVHLDFMIWKKGDRRESLTLRGAAVPKLAIKSFWL